MVKFTEVINASIEWTTTVLFRPFRPKKWLVLGFVALLSGYLTAGGCHSSSLNDSRLNKPRQAQAAIVSSATPQQAAVDKTVSAKQQFQEKIQKVKKNRILLLFIILLLAGIMAITMWLYSRFSFVFIEDIAKNDASIKAPFKKYKQAGNSLFVFYITMGVLSLAFLTVVVFACFLRLNSLGVFQEASAAGVKTIILACLPYALILFLSLIALSVIYLIVRDFVQIAMLKDQIKFTQAWTKTIKILGSNKAVFIKYIFVKIGLLICALFISGILNLAIAFGLLYEGLAITLVLGFFYKILPVYFRLSYVTVLVICAIPLFIFLWYCLMCIYLPFGVFFRTLSLKVMARLDGRYDLFRHNWQTEVL